MRERTLALSALAWLVPVVLAGCGASDGQSPGPPVPQDSGASGQQGPTGTVAITIPWASARSAIPAEVARIEISVTGSDMPPADLELTQADVTGGVATASIEVPVGSNRVARGVAYDTTDLPIGRGESLPFAITENETTPVSLSLTRVIEGSAIETATPSISSVLTTIETRFKDDVALSAVTRDTEKVRCRFAVTADEGYVYGSGRVVIVSRNNLETLEDYTELENELTLLLQHIDAAADNFDAVGVVHSRRDVRGVYAQTTGIYARIPVNWASAPTAYDGVLHVPDVPLTGARLTLDATTTAGFSGNVSIGTTTWQPSISELRRQTTTVSLSAGDQNVDMSINSGWYTYWGELTIEALFSQPIPANDPFQITDLTSMGNSPTIVAKHITELVLGP